MNYSSLSEYANVSGTDDPTLGERSTAFYIVSSLISFTATFAIMIPATAVIFTIAHNRDLHKYHYWFVANLMVCDILRALSYVPLFITLVTWIMAASFNLPLIASPELDIKEDNLSSCPYAFSIFMVINVVRITTAFAIIGFNIYLYWSTFRAKLKLKSIVADCSRPDNTVNSLRALIKKYKSLVRLSITLLLIIIIDGVLRIIRIILIVIAAYYGFTDSSVFYVIISVTIWIEHVNHPVVYGLMLREVRQGICCNN